MQLTQVLTPVKENSFFKNALIVIGTSLLFSLIAGASIPLPFTPVPLVLTMQTIFLFSFLLGKRGFYATMLYLAQGAMGLPVFSGWAAGGLGRFVGPTGGFLLGWALASLVIALVSERMERKTPVKVFGLLLLGSTIVHVCGFLHLQNFVGAEKALQLGFYPFIAVDLFKNILVHRILKRSNYLL